jgi:hypothetical protein
MHCVTSRKRHGVSRPASEPASELVGRGASLRAHLPMEEHPLLQPELID